MYSVCIREKQQLFKWQNNSDKWLVIKTRSNNYIMF